MTEKIALSRMLEAAFASRASGDVFIANENFRHAAVFFPDDTTVWTMLGIHAATKNENSSITGRLFERATVCDPTATAAVFNRAAWARDEDNEGLALLLLQRVLCLDPSEVRALFLTGIMKQERGAYSIAELWYKRVLQLAPDHPEAHTNLGFIELAHGVFESGWQNYEWRTRTALHEQRHPIDRRYPLWDGRTSTGRTILLTSEQGLGDTIQFVRYATQVASMGARVITQVDPSLIRIVSSLQNVVVTEHNRPLNAVDYQISLMSLPRIFSTTKNSIPYSTGPYLHIDQRLSARWRDRLGPKKGIRVGVVWSGSTPRRFVERSIPLSVFVRLFEDAADAVELICLQKEIWSRDLETFRDNGKIRFFGGQIADFSDTAALVDQCEFVITIDTSVAHLSGALGAETWLLLPSVADWRWFLTEDYSPWYSSMKVFRQRQLGDWFELIERLRTQLNRRVNRP